MKTLVGHSHKEQPDRHAEGGEMTSCHRAALPSHNLKGVFHSGTGPGTPGAPNATKRANEGSIPSTLPALPSKGGVGRRARVLNLGNGVTKLKPAKSLTATFRRAKSSLKANVDRRGQAPRGAANFLGDMASTLARVRRVTRGASGRTAVELGGGSNLRSLTATGNMTRYERFGVTPKAIRFPLDRMADLLEAIC